MSFIKGKVIDIIFHSNEGIIVKAECISGHKFMFPLGFYFKFDTTKNDEIIPNFEFLIAGIGKYCGKILGTPVGTQELLPKFITS